MPSIHGLSFRPLIKIKQVAHLSVEADIRKRWARRGLRPDGSLTADMQSLQFSWLGSYDIDRSPGLFPFWVILVSINIWLKQDRGDGGS